MNRRGFLKLALATPLLWLANAPAFSRTRRRDGSEQPSILVIVFDTLSAKHLSLHGYPRETTPNLARFAERATVYHAHYAAGNFTTPGTASLLTGAYPWSHRGLHLWGQVEREWQTRSLFHAFGSSGHTRIAFTHNPLVSLLLQQFRTDLEDWKPERELELLYDGASDLLFPNDYDMAYLAESRLLRPTYWRWQPSSLFASLLDKAGRFALRSRLESQWAERFPNGLPNHNGSQFFVVEDVIDWIRSLLESPDRPFLAYVHLLPPHHPYNTRREFVGKFSDGWAPATKPPHFFSMNYGERALQRLRQEYDEYLAYVDAEFGRLYDHMVETGAIDNTIVMFTSDHGEMFERGIFQHLTATLYEPVIRVPLLVSVPGQRARQDVYTPTSAIDVLPTLLHLAQQPTPAWCQGEVLPPFQPAAEAERSIFVVEAKSNPKMAPLTNATLAVIRGQYKLIHYLGYEGLADGYELYDLQADPEEVVDLYPSRPAVASSLTEELQEALASANRGVG